MLPARITEEWIEERLDAIYPAHTIAFVHFIKALRQNFDGDLDSMLIIALVSLGARGGEWRRTLLEEGDYERTIVPTNTLSIANATGIPRESVRRKLNAMRARGWLDRDPKGNWTLCAKIAEELRPSSRAAISYIRTIANIVIEADHQR